MPATGGRLPRLQVGVYIGTIRADSIVPTAPIFQFTDLLTARLPGVDVQSGGGMSGSGARVIIRGTGSLIAGSDPTVYLDGIRIAATQSRLNGSGPSGLLGSIIGSGPGGLTMGRLDDLSPNEIERVDVLSGPAATTQYGLDAWNGVVLVTTRRPPTASPQWTAYAEAGDLIPAPPRTPDTYVSDNGVPCGPGGAAPCPASTVSHFSPLRNTTTSPLTTGDRDRFGLQVAGGAGAGRYFLSGERQSEMGMVELPGPEVTVFTEQYGHAPLAGQLRPNSLDRTNLRATLGADFGDRGGVTVFGNAIGAGHRSTSDVGLASDVALGSGSPTIDGGWGGLDRPSNTFASESADRVERYIVGATASWSPISAIQGHVAIGADRSDAHSEVLTPSFNPCTGAFCGRYNESTEHVVTDEYTGDASVSADIPTTRGVASRTVVGLQYREQRQLDGAFTGSAPDGTIFPTSTFALAHLFLNDDGIQRGAYAEETIGWRDELSLTAALRAEGPNGLFGKASRGFPRIAASWVPMHGDGPILRVHAAYGIAEDLPVVQQSIGQLERAGFLAAPFGPFLVPEGPPGSEFAQESEAGIDISTANARVSAGASVYQRTIVHMALPEIFENNEGFEENVYVNSGTMRNHGLELTASVSPVRTTSTQWDVTLSGWINQNRIGTIGQLGGRISFGALFPVVAGHPLYSIWEPSLSFHDSNGDGRILANEIVLSAPAYQGSSLPTRGVSLQNAVTLLGGRFRVGALVDYKGGDKLVDPLLSFQLLSGAARGSVDPKATLAEQAEAVAVTSGAGYFGPIEDASFVRFRELSITVTVAPRFARALHTRSLAISLLARNLWLWTPYRGTDPEIDSNGNMDPAISETVVPQPRYFVARITLGY